MQILALDGHDGSGKSSLSKALADRFDCKPVAPFSGPYGPELLRAGLNGDVNRTIELGQIAINEALVNNDSPLIVLDRSWITVASLVPWDDFEYQWNSWHPTVLCWCDLDSTLNRLSTRQEPAEKIEWHLKYLDIYKTIADKKQVPILRTDKLLFDECVEKLVSILNSSR